MEIIQFDGDLTREVWTFSLNVSYALPCIYFDNYSFQTKETVRHKKWIRQSHWSRLDHRSNNIDRPLVPTDVEAQMRKRFQEYILTLPIKM